MADDSGQEKTFDPTEQKKRQFREEGKLPKSQEITGTVGLIVGFGSVLLYSTVIASELQILARKSWTVDDTPNVAQQFAWSMGTLVTVLSVPLAAMWVGSALVGLVQSRDIIPKDPIKLDWDRVNPISQFKEKFLSPTPFVELAKGLLKIGLVGAVVWWGVRSHMPMMFALIHQEPIVLLHSLREFAWVVVLRALPVAIAISILDYSYQVYQTNKKMMMTKEEIKQDQKNAEGDPYFKAARRRRQIEISRSAQSVQKVTEADAIIVNPTHYTVALRYRRDEAPAPIVIAKGLDQIALKMQIEARRHDIPRVENRQLARALYAQVDEGQMIPEDLYAAVAEILALIYQRKKNRSQ
jgi:flagellar biosynthetic protein FlhB